MPNPFFAFKQFTIHQDQCSMKVTTDACLFGAWVSVNLHQPTTTTCSVLDIGTGTGLLSLMIAQEYSNYSFKALELDPASAIQAKANVQLSPWEHKIEVIESDIRSYAPSEQFDIIISNPPFYQDELRSPDEKKNRAHHDQGLLLNELFDAIKKQLKPNGIFYLLLPYKRKREIKELFVKNGFTLEQEVNVRPAPHKEYFRLLLRGKNKNHSTGEISGEEITITREDGKYSDAFLSLLKSYYLYL